MSRGREAAVKYCTSTKRHEAVLQERLTRRADRTFNGGRDGSVRLRRRTAEAVRIL